MFKIAIRPEWQIERGGKPLLPRVVELLVGIHETGTLAAACGQMGLSYRYAWGLLREGHRAFGVPLVKSARGRGATLTPLGEKLVWADRRIAARLSPLFDSLASELEVEVERALTDAQGILRMQASHGFAVETLRAWFVRHDLPLDLKYRTSFEAFAALVGGECDLAGVHVPVGEFQAPVLKHYARWLKPDTQRLVLLATRRQGLMVAPGNPLRIQRLRDLVRDEVRFVNRQIGSGTRVLLDLMLQKEGIEPARVHGFDNSEFTHASVAAYVASGMADVGFGVETPASRFGLDFLPMATERYFFVCEAAWLESKTMARVIAELRSPAFRRAINALPGYDGTHCGQVLKVRDAFPGLA
ncbi:MAG TPA: substrate-binding domain-containing protein [Nevskiaceae bacterium]|nr:substrate-binding domain-containing protein [Nevskiaceae bacterium]